jgi:iron(III) transport system ATP-binding protein
MADRIVVMNQGRSDQVGAPEEIYSFPATPFVADFVGVMNFLPGRAGPGPDQVRCGTVDLQCAEPHGLAPGTPISLAVRPEDVRVGPTPLWDTSRR